MIDMPLVVPHRPASAVSTRRGHRRSWADAYLAAGVHQRSLRSRLILRAQDRWPELVELTIRHRGQYAYIDGELTDGTTLPLFRLRYGGSANSWGFAIHLASREGYQDSILPTGHPVGTPEEALDCACGLYLNDPTAWTEPPTN